MIIFETLRYKNFLSSGNTFTEIDLAKNKTTLVVGTNGSGKSTMLDAISFGLFGKPHRSINKPQLVNSINGKQCVVEVEFKIGQAQFKVVRGIKPNVFEIWKNGTMINQSSHAKEYQKILEQNILKLNHKSFHQVVVLGSSSFIPFMQLSAWVRREVIEDLLDINIDDYVIEIGPGDGALTTFLIGKTKNFLAIEYDHYYVKILKKKFSKIKIIHENILNYDFSKFKKKN